MARLADLVYAVTVHAAVLAENALSSGGLEEVRGGVAQGAHGGQRADALQTRLEAALAVPSVGVSVVLLRAEIARGVGFVVEGILDKTGLALLGDVGAEAHGTRMRTVYALLLYAVSEFAGRTRLEL